MRRGERVLRNRVGFYGDGLQLLVLGALPILLIALQLVSLVKTHTVAVDFRQGPWIAGHRLLAGFSPYPGAHSSQLEGITFVYPAVAAIVLALFSFLRQNAAAQIFTLLSMVALLGTLRVLDVRDGRVYLVALIWPAVMSGWETGNITLLLGLGVALVWRYRDRPAVSGGLIALVISMKLFLWPLGLWLIATKRYRALAWGAGLGLIMNLLAWALLGFDQLTLSRSLMSTLAKNQESRGYSLVALGVNDGLHRSLAYGLALGLPPSRRSHA